MTWTLPPLRYLSDGGVVTDPDHQGGPHMARVTYVGPFAEVEVTLGEIGRVVKHGETIEVSPEIAGRGPDGDDLGEGLLAQTTNWASAKSKAAHHAAEHDPGEPIPPARNAKKADWVDFAVASGLDPDEAEALTKDELIERYDAEEGDR